MITEIVYKFISTFFLRARAETTRTKQKGETKMFDDLFFGHKDEEMTRKQAVQRLKRIKQLITLIDVKKIKKSAISSMSWTILSYRIHETHFHIKEIVKMLNPKEKEMD